MSDKITDVQRKMADTIKANMKLEDGGTFDAAEKTFADTLEGTELDEKTVKAVHTHHAEFMAAAALATGELAIEAFTDNKDLNRCTSSFRAGRSTVDVLVDRTREVSGGPPKAGEKPTRVTKYGYIDINSRQYGTKASSGALSRVKAKISEEAKKALQG